MPHHSLRVAFIVFSTFYLLTAGSVCLAQTATYHLHKEASSTPGLFQLAASGPDGSSIAIQTVDLKGKSAAEYVIKEFDTQSGVPNSAGVIPSGSTLTFNLWMKKTASLGTMYPRARVRINNSSGTLLCTATGTTALTTTLTNYAVNCSTSSNVSMSSADRFYLWIGVNLTGTSSSNTFKGEVDIEGTLGGNYDSQTTLPLATGAPTVTSLTPSSGAINSSIVIAGSNFRSAKGSSTVQFNGITSNPTGWSDTSITAPVPSGATTGPVVVTVGGQASSGLTFTVTPAPNISSLAPNSGAVGASATVNGTNFGDSQGNGGVKFSSNKAAAITSWNSTAIVVTVPTGAVNGNVVVTAAGGVASNGKSFTVLPTPTITGLSQGSGTVNTPITVNGSGFGSTQGSGTVTFGGVAASVSSWGSSAISVLVPASAAPGVVQVAVNTAGVSSNTSPFTVIPSVTGLSPSSAPVGGSVSIQGNNFGISGSGTVTFNGLTAPVLGWSQTSITTQVPSGATSGNLVVTSNGTPSSGVAFSVVPGPSMTGMSTSSGTAGTSVTISGSDFGVTQSSANGQVLIGGAVAGITNWSNTSITAQVPPNAPPGSGSIAVTLAGVPSNSYPFTVIPSLNAIGPNPGGAGSLVSISGADLGTSEGSVQFNGVSATIVDWNEQSVSAKVPALPVSTVPVTVTVAGITTNAIQFSVAPTIATLSPAAGPVGTDVSITGSNFGSSGTVTFNGVNAGTTNWTDTVIVAQVPNAATSGPVLVSVSGVSTNPVPFTVSTTPGAITAISITPATFAMLIGDARTLQAVDSNGSPITGVSWSSSDTGIASFDAETGVLTANAEGQATITGTFQNFTARAAVNVYVADDNGYYPEGAVLWSGQAMAGYSAGQVIQATPTDSNLVDLFALDMDSQQANASIRGLTADGQQKWTTQLTIPTIAPVFVPDRQGGLLITQQPVQPGYSPYSLLKVDNNTGKPSWIYSPLSDGSYGCDAWIPDKVSVHPDGTIYAVKLSHVCFSPSSYSVRATVVALDGATGLPKFSVDLPQSRDTEYYNGLLYQDSNESPYTSPISIMPDGSVYLEAESTVSRTDQFCTSSCVGTQSITDTVSLIRILSDGSSSTQVLNSYTCSANFPGSSCYPPNQVPAEVIPDGQGGVLATYSYCDYQYCPSQQPGGTLRLSHIDALGGRLDYTLPFAYADFWYGSIVLGDNTLFGTDGFRIVAFDLASGTTRWTRDAAQDHYLDLIAATDDGGLVAKDGDTTGTFPWPETPVRFDSSGVPTNDSWMGNGLSQVSLFGAGQSSMWAGISVVSSGQLFQFGKPAELSPNSTWSTDKNKTAAGASLPDNPADLRLVPHRDCPGNPRELVYELGQRNQQTGQYTDNPNCSGPNCSWYVSEHQTNKCLADPTHCTGISTDLTGNRFEDRIYGVNPATSNQTFTISLTKPPGPNGPQKPGTEIHAVIVRDPSNSQDYGTLGIVINIQDGVYIQGMLRWPGVTCQ